MDKLTVHVFTDVGELVINLTHAFEVHNMKPQYLKAMQVKADGLVLVGVPFEYGDAYDY